MKTTFKSNRKKRVLAPKGHSLHRFGGICFFVIPIDKGNETQRGRGRGEGDNTTLNSAQLHFIVLYALAGLRRSINHLQGGSSF